MKAKRYFPNFLSVLRICLTPFVIWFLLCGRIYSGAAMLIFTLGVITDFYDGYFARKHAITSRAGNFLDPLADKFLVLSTFAAFWYIALLPLWMLCVIALREGLVTGLRLGLECCGRTMRTSMLGKLKTVLQFIAIYVLFFSYWSVFCITPLFVDMVLYVVVGFTLFTGLYYFYVNKK